jgi:hypothetical protein
MGSSLAALVAGIIPESSATPKHRITPIAIQAQGMMKLVSVKTETIFPARIPSTIPNIPPN